MSAAASVVPDDAYLRIRALVAMWRTDRRPLWQRALERRAEEQRLEELASGYAPELRAEATQVLRSDVLPAIETARSKQAEARAADDLEAVALWSRVIHRLHVRAGHCRWGF